MPAGLRTDNVSSLKMSYGMGWQTLMEHSTVFRIRLMHVKSKIIRPQKIWKKTTLQIIFGDKL